MKPVWGIDLGGTKIEGAILESPESATVISRMRIPTEQQKGYRHIINQIVELVDKMRKDSGLSPEKIGIGTPGTFDPNTGLHKNSNTTCLNGMPFRKDLQEALGLPLNMANDANCFAMAEARLGTVREEMPEAGVVFGVIMGTGVGGGVVINGQVLNGRQGIAGEWGHNYLDDSGGPCYCGKTGCVETIISGPALERYYRKISGEQRRLREIVERHRANNDPHATQTVERLIYFFGKGLSSVVNLLDPDAVVLGGGLGNIDLLYDRGVESVRNFVFNTRLDTVFLAPRLGDSAGVFGAALL
jgi:predicted NBD/HSP70 family sugar kinase